MYATQSPSIYKEGLSLQAELDILMTHTIKVML